MKEIPPRPKPKSDRSEGQQIGEIVVHRAIEAIPYVGGVLSDSLRVWAARLQDAIRKNDKERLEQFYEGLLAGDAPLDPEIADKMLDDRDFHALLRACLADVESEKVRAYAHLAKSVATGRVPKTWVRHFILSLRDISMEELTRLQKAHVASHHALMPDVGPLVQESQFLQPGAPGSFDSIVIGNLVARGFIHDSKLSPAGSAFIEACMTPLDLSPAAIGYKTWTDQKIGILSYEIGNAHVDKLATALLEEFRVFRMKSSIFALNRNNVTQARMLHTHAVLLLNSASQHLMDNLEHLARFAEKVPVFAVTLNEPVTLPNVRIARTITGAGRPERDVVNEIRDAIDETLRGLRPGASSNGVSPA